MLSREEFIQDRSRVFDKVYGALSGIAIGDSFGDAARMQDNRAPRDNRLCICFP